MIRIFFLLFLLFSFFLQPFLFYHLICLFISFPLLFFNLSIFLLFHHFIFPFFTLLFFYLSIFLFLISVFFYFFIFIFLLFFSTFQFFYCSIFTYLIFLFSQLVGVIDLLTSGLGIDVGVRSLTVHTSGLKLLLGTSGGELRELVCDIRLKSREKEQIKIKGTFNIFNRW